MIGCNTSKEDILRNVIANTTRDLPVLAVASPNNMSLAIVGGGPSMRKFLPVIKRMSWDGRANIIGVNGAGQALSERNINVDGVVLADARPEMVAFVRVPLPAVYFAASQCHPKVFNALRGTATPHSGAYCLRLTLSGGTADAYLVEGDIDIAANTTRYFAFDMWISPDFDATADDTVNVLECLASSTVEATFGFRYVASTDAINFGIGETAPTSFTAQNIPKGVWHTVELTVDVDNSGSDDGTIDLYVTREGDPAQTVVSATQVASLDQGAVTQGFLGIQDHLATTTGTILIDNFIMDDARIYPHPRRPVSPVFTKSAHAFVGPGWIDGAALLTDEDSNVMRLWDTDNSDTNATQSFVVSFDVDNQTSVGLPMFFRRGCYVELSGTAPRGLVLITQSSDKPGVRGPKAYVSDGLLRRYGITRKVAA